MFSLGNQSSIVEERGLDNYIPFRLADLRESITNDFPNAFRSEDTKVLFAKLIKWLSLRNNIRLALTHDDIYDIYCYLDPDNDVEAPDIGMTPEQKTAYVQNFRKLLLAVLDKGEFDPVTQEMIQASYKQDGADGFMGTGLTVKPVDTTVVDYQAWYRGKVLREQSYRSWRNLWFKKKRTTQAFDRLVVMFQKRTEEETKSLRKEGSKPSIFQKVRVKLFHFFFG